ncbi:trypsin-like peptidase domain-containing protein [Streptomyces phaeochromogenes]|uniref:VMAP-C domain-containing protein n=1 Tax=Streptomyces phaeochromogenes TaxID=1923 RepID=UPI00340FB5BC
MPVELDSAQADGPLHRSFVSVRDTDRPVGAGVLIAPQLVLTCAHVVNSALRREQFDITLPSRRQALTLVMPHVDGERPLAGRVVPELWRPPRSRREPGQPTPPPVGKLPYYGDLAVLELDAVAPAGAEPAPFLPQREGREVVAQWASGHVLTTLRAVTRVCAHPWIALDVVGGAVTPGFSGGPLWDRGRQAVVGLVVAAHEADGTRSPTDNDRRSGPYPGMYAIGWTSIETELSELPPVSIPAAGPGRQQLLAVLEDLLPSAQAVQACEKTLAARLGRKSAGLAAQLEELASLAIGVRRGVPELLDVIYDHLTDWRPHVLESGAWQQALCVARLIGPRERLTLKQRRALNAQLAECRSTDPVGLVWSVLPHADQLPTPGDLAEATDILEGYDPGPGQIMPPLIQGVVRIGVQERAAGRATVADDLDSWTRRVAIRLGVAPEAVLQHRVDLSASGTTTFRAISREGEPPKVQVELLPVAPGHLFTYQIWTCGTDGRHEMVLTQDTDVSSEQIVRDIRHVLRTEVREHPETAVVEFFLAPAWLGLDVDAWELPASVDDGGFHPGVERRVVLRSSERTAETHAGWRRRTLALSDSPRVLLDESCTQPKAVRARLEIPPEPGIIVLCCDRELQGQMLRQCIQAGVHTVLWHRERHGRELAAYLVALVEGIDHRQIPEAVRLERIKAMAADPDRLTHKGSQLSLLYDGPDHRPPPLAPGPWALTLP